MQCPTSTLKLRAAQRALQLVKRMTVGWALGQLRALDRLLGEEVRDRGLVFALSNSEDSERWAKLWNTFVNLKSAEASTDYRRSGRNRTKLA